MLPPLIRRSRRRAEPRRQERGFTMALVAVSLVAIIAMAALSIDIGTLYQAKAEAQRAADAAALTAARVISISGITGDPAIGNTDGSWADICGGATSPATLAAINVAQQNLISGVAVLSANVTVKYGSGSGGATTTDCTGAGANFGVNPVVTANVTSGKLPIFFARVFSLFGSNFSGTTVSASATAEVFNPSGSASLPSGMVPVQPRCVKPWIIPNHDPINATTFLNLDGSITTQGISQLGPGVIGETFSLASDCASPGVAGTCALTANPPQGPPLPPANTARYIPAPVAATLGAIPSGPSCALTAGYQSAIGGCDQSTVYACGVIGGSQADLTENPVNPTVVGGDTATATECLIHQLSGGNDQLAGFPAPVFPFQIQAGFGNPLVQAGASTGVNANNIITTSNSIVTLPIYDGTALAVVASPPVTIVGFLQVFINTVDVAGNLSMTVLNVSGCGSSVAAGTPSANGTSPVPVRLITPP
jgi:hypothetical protein